MNIADIVVHIVDDEEAVRSSLAFLLSAGASLDVLNRYLHSAFRVSQRRAMAELLQRAEPLSLGGFRVAVCVAELSGEETVGSNPAPDS